MFQKLLIVLSLGSAVMGVTGCGDDTVVNGAGTSGGSTTVSAEDALTTATPIKHVVVIFNENVSFDHYFATYPSATNPPGEPAFNAAAGTPKVNGLSSSLLVANGNFTNAANGANAANPFRLDRTQAHTSSQNHAYTAEQLAYNNGSADLFPLNTGSGTAGGSGAFGTKGQVMGYFDGNTVTALWNYAQHFAMSDNAYTDTYGPSTPGALEVVSGQTNGLQLLKTSQQPVSATAKGSYYVNDSEGGYTLINDVDPGNDVCSSATDQALLNAKNIGDLLNAKAISWGGYMGGFDLTVTNANGTTGCKRSTYSPQVASIVTDYIPHHAWFQYFTSTANPTHARPSALQAVGQTLQGDGKTADPANHQYDLTDFFAAVKTGNFPAVNFLKAPAYQDGHPGYSDPLDEQAFVAKVVNFLQQQPDWKNTVVIVAYDDSDGWYDHAYTAPTSASFDPVADQLNGAGICGAGTAQAGVKGLSVNGRCGPGTRIPLLVISPWAKANYVSSVRMTQASVVRFIEDNWLGGTRLGGGSFDASGGALDDLFDFKGAGANATLYLDPTEGTVLSAPPVGSNSPSAS